MEPALDQYFDYLRTAGVDFVVAPDLQRDDDHETSLLPDGERPRVHRDLCCEKVLEYDAREGALGSDHATLSVARELVRLGPELAGRTFLDVGCGTGLLSVCAALQGAHAVGTDIDPEAVRLSRKNSEVNGVAIDVRHGSLAEPIQPDESFAIIVTNLPHKPHPPGIALPLGQAGGPEGDDLWEELDGSLNDHLDPGARLFFFLHSLPHPRLLRRMNEKFELTVRRWKLRWLQPGEYGELQQVFDQRHEQRTSFLWEHGNRKAMVACVWEARLKEAEV